MLRIEDIRIRDPFILTDCENGFYYMYGTTALVDGSIAAKNTFSVYRSRDLVHFEEPKVVFDGARNNYWATRDYWAPEVHAYNGKYYLFGTGYAEGKCRGTNIFVCDTPDGDFRPLSDHAITPLDWECLDGPFLYREDGKIKMIWSSFYAGRYLVLEAESDRLAGPWKHSGSRFDFDGGHAMLFETLGGERMISLHRPNAPHDAERAFFCKF